MSNVDLGTYARILARLLLGGLAIGCSPPKREVFDGRPRPAPISALTATPVTVGSADAGAPIDLLHPFRVSDLPSGEWTIFYPTQGVAKPPVFERVLRSPRGGLVVLGAEDQSLGERFLLRLDDEGTPRWGVRLTVRLMGPDMDLAVSEDGTIAFIAHHRDRVTVEGQEVVASGEDDFTVSLLLFGDDGKLRRVLSRRRPFVPRVTKVVWYGGFVTTRTDLFDPEESPPDGLITIDADGQILRKTARSVVPLLLASGRDLVAISVKAGNIVQDGRTLLRTSSKDSPYIAVALDRAGAFRWGHAFSEALHQETAVAQDERGHVFAAFRHGESHGYADDPFAAIVYELDDKGREVHRFKYDPNAAFTRLFPAPAGLTAIGWVWASELTFGGKPVPLPPDDPANRIVPGLLMRFAPDGHLLGSRDLLSSGLPRETQTGLASIVDAAADGSGHLAVVGAVTAGAPFAGLRVAKGEPSRPFVARVRRP